MSQTENCLIGENKWYNAYQTQYHEVITDLAQDILDIVTNKNVTLILSVKGSTLLASEYLTGHTYGRTREMYIHDLAKPKFLGMIAYKKCYVLYGIVNRNNVKPPNTKIMVINDRNPNGYIPITEPTKSEIMDWIIRSFIEDHTNEDAVHKISHFNGLFWKHI